LLRLIAVLSQPSVGSPVATLLNSDQLLSNCLTRAFSACYLMSPTPAAAVFEQASDQGGPAGLVACSQPAARVPVEVLIEEDVVTPVRVVRVARERAVAGPQPAFLRHEQGTEPLREFVGHTIQIPQPARTA